VVLFCNEHIVYHFHTFVLNVSELPYHDAGLADGCWRRYSAMRSRGGSLWNTFMLPLLAYITGCSAQKNLNVCLSIVAFEGQLTSR